MERSSEITTRSSSIRHPRCGRLDRAVDSKEFYAVAKERLQPAGILRSGCRLAMRRCSRP